jgi:hypothetical protein
MQLIIRVLFAFVLIASFSLPTLAEEGQLEQPIEIDFLMEYYGQDGDHAAVTGGEGTQQLSDLAPNIHILVPYGDKAITVSMGFDVYSSASTDNIDYVQSSASSSDMRTYGELGFSTNDPHRRSNYGISLGMSNEYDYQSFIFGAHYALLSSDQNSELSLSGKLYVDQLDLIYPVELRPALGGGGLSEDDENYKSTSRRTYSATLTYNQVLTTRAQASLSLDLVQQTGYLATPFHRVYVAGENVARIETLPDSRLKYPVSLRFNYSLSDLIVLRLQGRYYQDDFGITAQTINIETPLRMTQEYALIPFVRYHSQGESDYFAPFGAHVASNEFYTSDYDLSAFTSTKYGLGFRYYPLQPISQYGLPWLANSFYFKRIDLRVAYYDRSDGLTAWNASIGFSFFVQ